MCAAALDAGVVAECVGEAGVRPRAVGGFYGSLASDLSLAPLPPAATLLLFSTVAAAVKWAARVVLQVGCPCPREGVRVHAACAPVRLSNRGR